MLNINDLKSIFSSNEAVEKAFHNLVIAIHENAKEDFKKYIKELEKTEEIMIETIKELRKENKELTEELNDKNEELTEKDEKIEEIEDKIRDIVWDLENLI
jgi:uncharacterized protein YoxC